MILIERIQGYPQNNTALTGLCSGRLCLSFLFHFFSWVFFVCLFLGMEEKGVGVTIWVTMICNQQPGLFLWKSVVNSGYWGENIFDDKFLSCFFP